MIYSRYLENCSLGHTVLKKPQMLISQKWVDSVLTYEGLLRLERSNAFPIGTLTLNMAVLIVSKG